MTYTCHVHDDVVLQYFWSGPSARPDHKLLSNQIICDLSHRSHAAHNHPWLRVVSPDLLLMLIASICLVAFGCVDMANAMVTKHMAAGGSVLTESTGVA